MHHKNLFFPLLLLILFTIAACQNNNTQFRIKAQYKNISSATFYIYSTDATNPTFDTIQLTNGSFIYQTNINSHATYHLIYPNLSTQTIFATPGHTVKITGDAQHLNNTKVTGTKPNNQYTQFRLNTINLSPDSIAYAAQQFIKQQPASPVSFHLLQQHILTNKNFSNEQIDTLVQLITQAQSSNLNIAANQSIINIQHLYTPQRGDTLPNYQYTTIDNDTVSLHSLNQKPLLINFFATWDSRSVADLMTIKRYRKQHPDSINNLSISLDVDYKSLEAILQIDTVNWPVIAPLRGIDNTPVQQFNPPHIPWFILSDTTHTIILTANSLNNNIIPALDSLLQHNKSAINP